MKKLLDFLKSPLAFPVIVLGSGYIFWLSTVPMGINSTDDNFRNYLAGLVIFGIYIFIVVTQYQGEKSLTWIFLPILLSLLIDIPAFLYVRFFLYETSAYGQTENVPIFATGITLAAAYPALAILLKDENKSDKVLKLISFLVILPVLGANITYIMNFYPRRLATAETDKHKYYVTTSYDWDFHSYQNFYKCKKWGLNCRSLYFSYSLSLGPIIVDNQNKEINLIGMGGILYTDGENPRSYTRPASEFQGHIYQFSETCKDVNSRKGRYSCDSYTYILHQCNLDYKSCTPLPIQYNSLSYDTLLIMEGNEATGELNIYDSYLEDERILIATFGENSHCYVEGCEILMKE
ncbi:hypothetical protein ANAEL_01252 [Anaerolineales bacterium]|nr:hypothetical protein ANAEL_01252 [Anaerolineales bacterium]